MKKIVHELSLRLNSFEECYQLEHSLFHTGRPYRVDELHAPEWQRNGLTLLEVSRRMFRFWLKENKDKSSEENEQKLRRALSEMEKGCISMPALEAQSWLPSKFNPIQGRGGGHCDPPPPPLKVYFLKYLTIWKVLASQTFWLLLVSIFLLKNVRFRTTKLQSGSTIGTGFFTRRGGLYTPSPCSTGLKNGPPWVGLRSANSQLVPQNWLLFVEKILMLGLFSNYSISLQTNLLVKIVWKMQSEKTLDYTLCCWKTQRTARM